METVEELGFTRFHSEDGLYFTRDEDEYVVITKTDGKPASEGGKILFEQKLDPGTWVSAVLAMTAFGERPGDFVIWMAHQQGNIDVLNPFR